jgi:hypothetical protein
METFVGEMYYAPRPECPEHGTMSHIQPPPGEDRVWPPAHWVCHGWDGEGCDHTVTDDELDWTVVGTVEQMQWRFDRTLPRPGMVEERD